MQPATPGAHSPEPRPNPPPATEREYRRNYAFHIANGLFAGFGDALVDSRLIVTAFLSQLTSSNVLIGLIAPLRDTGWFLPQLFVSPLVERAPRKIDVYRAVTVVRAVTWLLLVGAVFLITDPGPLLLVFFLCTLLLSTASGVAGLPFMIVTTKVIPAQRRATLFGVRQSLGGMLGVLAGGAVVVILGGGVGLDFPRNYALLFAAAAVLNITANWAFGQITEQADLAPRKDAHMRGEFRRAWRIARTDGEYRKYMLARFAIIVGAASVPFLTVFAKRELTLDGGALGTLLSITLASSLVSNLAWARLSDKRGNRLTLLVGALLGGLYCAVAVAQTSHALQPSPEVSRVMLAATFVIGGVMTAAVNVSSGPLIMELAPVERRSLYFGLTNSLLGVIMLATSLIGLIVDRFGFTALYVFAAAAYGFALVQLFRLKEPRSR